MSYFSPTEVLNATNERIVEISALAAQNNIEGIESIKEVEVGLQLLTLKYAYNSDISEDEKQAILYCLIKVSEKFTGAALTNENAIGNVVTKPPSNQNVFFVGTGSDISHFWGTGNDISGFL